MLKVCPNCGQASYSASELAYGFARTVKQAYGIFQQSRQRNTSQSALV